MLHTFPLVFKGRFFLISKLLHLVIISFILATIMCDLRLILLGEIRCWSLSGFNRLKRIYRVIMSIPLWASVQAARAAVAAETSGDVMERARLLSLWGESSFSSGNSSASSKLDQLIGLGRKFCWRINFIRIILIEIFHLVVWELSQENKFLWERRTFYGNWSFWIEFRK